MSQPPESPTVDADRIGFEIDRLKFSAGELEVMGRWSGIRGRRFMRPALNMTLADGSERRSLAELDDKPWAAEEGEPWVARFRTDVDPGDAAATVLTVAPDILVPLTSARAERRGVPPPPVTRRRASRPRPLQLERLRETLAASDRALESERARRASIDRTLEEERAESRRLRAEVGRLGAELDLAKAAQAEAAAAASDLESARRELLAAERRHERLSREHDRTVDAQAQASAALHERAGALESAREALSRERAETDRLRAELAGPAARSPAAVRSPSPGSAIAGPPTRGDRLMNPALRYRTNWAGRILALLVILAVIAAVLLVIQSTI